MKNNAVAFLTVVCLACSSHAFAHGIEIKAVVASAERHFPLIIASQQSIAKAEADLITAKGSFDPKFSSHLIAATLNPYQSVYSENELYIPINNSGSRVFVGYRYGRGDFPVYYQGRWTYPYGELNTGADIPLLRDRSIDDRRARLAISENQINFNKQNLKLQKISVIRQASLSYWDWVAEGKKLIVQKYLLKLAEFRQGVVEKRVHHGDAPAIDAVENNQVIVQRKMMVKNQQQIFLKASQYLSLFYRDKHGDPIVLDLKDLPEVFRFESNGAESDYSSKDIRHFADNHPSVRRVGYSKEIANIQLKLAVNKLLPKLNNRIFLANDFGPPNFGGSIPPLNRTTLNYELNFEYPFFQRQARGAIAASRAELLKFSQEQKLAFEQIVVAIKSASIQLETAKNLVDFAEKAVVLAQKVERAEKIRFDHGDSNLFYVNQREQTTVDAEIREIDNITNYYKSKVELKFALGDAT